MSFEPLAYRSGYVLLAFISADLVERWHWLTESQLLDAIAVGQVTPSSIHDRDFRWLRAGWPKWSNGCDGRNISSCVRIVALSGPLVPRIRRSATAGTFLDSVNAGALALMVVVTYQLGRAAITDIATIALALLSGVILFCFRINSVWLIIGGAIAGLINQGFRA